MKSSKDPLTAATTLILKPVLVPLGFQKHTQRKFVRLTNDIVQVVILEKSGWGNPVFRLQYSCLAVYPPCDGLTLSSALYEVLPSINKFRDMDTQEHAESSMREVVRIFNELLFPWFEETKTMTGLLDFYQRDSKNPQDHHRFFAKACCFVAIGDLSQAWANLETAIEQYQKDGRDWCFGYIEQCSELLEAIRSQSVESLLNKWREHSIEHLGLKKFQLKSA